MTRSMSETHRHTDTPTHRHTDTHEAERERENEELGSAGGQRSAPAEKRTQQTTDDQPTVAGYRLIICGTGNGR